MCSLEKLRQRTNSWNVLPMSLLGDQQLAFGRLSANAHLVIEQRVVEWFH